MCAHEPSILNYIICLEQLDRGMKYVDILGMELLWKTRESYRVPKMVELGPGEAVGFSNREGDGYQIPEHVHHDSKLWRL